MLKSNGIQFNHRSHKCEGFHGTSQKSADSILAHGFNIDLADPKAWLGLAIYFYDNAPYSGNIFAMCWALHGAHHRNPAVLAADLTFELLLDLEDAHNGPLFWELFNFLRRQPDSDGEVDEKFVAFWIGTQVAPEMGSDGVGWRFPMQEPPARRGRKTRKQYGFAVKKLSVIGRVRPYTGSNEP